MSEQSLQVSISPRAGIIDPPWLHMEIKDDQPDDGMTVAQAAALIDAAYNIKPCLPLDAQRDVWDQSVVEDVAETEAAQRRFAEALNDAGYGQDAGETLDDLIAYKVTIKIFRSHQGELYKLQMANGRAGAPRRCEGRVVHTVDVKGATSHTFDNPIINAPVMSWQGISGPKVKITGNTVHWEGEVDGTLRAEFDSVWDEVEITVTGDYRDRSMITGTPHPIFGTGWYSGTEDGSELDDYQDITCSVLAFYHFQFEELILNRPEKDSSTPDRDQNDITRFVNENADDGYDDGQDQIQGDKCRQHVNETIICECDGKEESRDYYEVVPCLPGYSEGSTLPGSEERTTFSNCGYTDEVHDNAFYLEKCCKNWPFPGPMPKCKRVVKRFSGSGDKNFKESDYPKGTVFIPVSPRFGLCGEWVFEQEIHAENCCDGVPPIYWDEDNSAEVIDGTGAVFILGSSSKLEKTWKVRGSGFYVDAALTQRDIVTTQNSITIYQKPDACGTAAIYVSDGCSSDEGFVRSPNGHWQSVPLEQIDDRDVQAEYYTSFLWEGSYCSGKSYATFHANVGKYMYQQTYMWTDRASPSNVGKSSCDCTGVPTSWQPYRDEVAGLHNMPEGEIQLIAPFSGARLLPPNDDRVFSYNALTPPPNDSNSTGRGVSHWCYQYRDQYNHLDWGCITRGGTTYADGSDPLCPDTNPQAWEWVC